VPCPRRGPSRWPIENRSSSIGATLAGHQPQITTAPAGSPGCTRAAISGPGVQCPFRNLPKPGHRSLARSSAGAPGLNREQTAVRLGPSLGCNCICCPRTAPRAAAVLVAMCLQQFLRDRFHSPLLADRLPRWACATGFKPPQPQNPAAGGSALQPARAILLLCPSQRIPLTRAARLNRPSCSKRPDDALDPGRNVPRPPHPTSAGLRQNLLGPGPITRPGQRQIDRWPDQLLLWGQRTPTSTSFQVLG